LEAARVKISIGQVEIDIRNGAKITYDSNTDTISIEPPYPIQRHAQPVKTSPKEKPLMIEHDRSRPQESIPMTKTQLTQKILSVLSSSDEPVWSRTLTMHCLGNHPDANKVKYLKLLLDEMVDQEVLVRNVEKNRNRYMIA
jgi:hypothetical protein